MPLSEKTYDWNALGKAWSEDSPQPVWRAHTDAVYRSLVSQWLPTAVRMLLKTDAFDEAVSAGVYPALADRCERIVAADIATPVLAAARARYGLIECTCADVRKLPFADESFDAVVSLSTLDHFDALSEIEVSLAEIARVLRPGGTLLLTLDNLVNPLVALRAIVPFRLLHRLGIVPYQVGRTCGPRRARRMVENAGFQVRDTAAILHCPRVVAVAVAGRLRPDQSRAKRMFLSFLAGMEHLRWLPTRYLTGNFVALLATKPAIRPRPLTAG